MSTSRRVAARYRLLLAMSLSDAKALLGFPPTANPSDSEVNKALRMKALEHHPDRGGDAAKMVEVNTAADILKGKQRPKPDYGGYGGGGYSPPTRSDRSDRWTPKEKAKEVVVTFDEAKSKAGVPAGVEWMFVTESHHSGYSSDEYVRQATGWVAVGRTDDMWVFLRAENYRSASYVYGDSTADHDEWTLEVTPLFRGKSDVTASDLFGGVKRVWKGFAYLKKQFNSKVVSAEGWKLGTRLPQGRSLSIKNWMINSGLLKEEDLKTPRKYDIQVTYEEFSAYGNADKSPPPGYYSDSKGYYRPYLLTLIINGRDYTLPERAIEMIHKGRIGGKPFLEWLFGKYRYSGTVKSLSKKRDAKKVMALMADKLPVADWVKEALTAASQGGK